MNRNIKKVAVLGSGVMGSRIACHFANIGVEALLLDIMPRELTEADKQKGITAEHPGYRNRIVTESLKSAVQGRPSPLYKKEFANRIKTGNFEDDLHKISDCDWIIEAVIENLEIKQKLFTRVDEYRKEGSIVSSNTSGIPIHLMLKDRSEDFRKHFLGTHFFNPPRYLRLLEIIPTPETLPEVTEFMMDYGDLFLGKQMVLCKDTPAFIANRVGLFALMKVFHLVEDLGLTVEETDKITGPAIGRPKTGSFRLADLVGIDTAAKVIAGLQQACPNDERKDVFKAPAFLNQIIEKGWFGDKTKQGFYKKVRKDDGSSDILALDLKTMEYRPKEKVRLQSLESASQAEGLENKIRAMFSAKDKGGELVRRSLLSLFAYVSNRIPEIADDLYKIDDAMKAGFGWDLGPFEVWDIIGPKKAVEMIRESGEDQVAGWVDEFLQAGCESFYKIEGGRKLYYNLPTKSYMSIPGTENLVILDHLRDTNVVWKNGGSTLFDIGDGILNLEFQTKMNTIGAEVIEGIHKAIELAEQDYRGLVIGNQATNFSAGANLALLLMYGIEQEFDEIDMAVRTFQQTAMRIRYSAIPVVVAPHGLTLGGGCEVTLHADHVQAAAETYIGLVEFGVGLIPGGGGTKEMTLRVSDAFREGDVELNVLRDAFLTIGQAKVATSAHEARDLKILRDSDGITINIDRQLKDAKEACLLLAEAGYTQPVHRNDIKVQGRAALSGFYTGAYSMYAGGFITEHELKMSKKLAWVMCGGDLTGATEVSEQYLLDLEREAFLSLMGERKTLERIQHMLKTGKPLRN